MMIDVLSCPAGGRNENGGEMKITFSHLQHAYELREFSNKTIHIFCGLCMQRSAAFSFFLRVGRVAVGYLLATGSKSLINYFNGRRVQLTSTT